MTCSRKFSPILATFLGSVLPAISATVTAYFSSATTAPITSASYTATGNDVAMSLGFAPPRGTDITVVKNNGLAFISGQFTNLLHGQKVNLLYNGITYKFVANYFGGSGNDLVLHWDKQDLAAWGSNSSGQLGDGTITDSSAPVLISRSGIFSGKTVVEISAGGSHSLALCSDGTVVQWGTNGFNSSNNLPVKVTTDGVLAGKTVVSVSAGNSHSLALCSDGSIAAWGDNSSGRLGNGSTTSSLVPVLVTQSNILAGRVVVAISAGEHHSLALCSDGTIVTWGWVNTICRANAS